jgi:hypothetical protein
MGRFGLLYRGFKFLEAVVCVCVCARARAHVRPRVSLSVCVFGGVGICSPLFPFIFLMKCLLRVREK